MRTTSRLAVFLTATALLVGACTDDTTSANEAHIAAWQGRMKGHTVSYRINVGCFCPGIGEWRIVERDGEVIAAEFLGEGEPVGDGPAYTLSEGLRYADDANGPVDFSDVTDTGFGLSVDQEEDAVDDEFGMTVSELVVED